MKFIRSFANWAKQFFFVFMFAMLTMTVVALGQDVPPQVSTDEFLSFLLQSIGGMHGASTLGMSVIVSQILLKLLLTKIGDVAGKWKLLAVYGLTMLIGVLTLMYKNGLTIWPALLHAQTMAAFQVFAHQLYKQLSEKPVLPAPPIQPAA